MPRPHCKLDERGWCVPERGTKARQIYELLISGNRPREVAAVLGISSRSAAAVASKVYNGARKSGLADIFDDEIARECRAKSARFQRLAAASRRWQDIRRSQNQRAAHSVHTLDLFNVTPRQQKTPFVFDEENPEHGES